jgi:hypothetical protein|tara:strand:- start:4 stop:513 length:510 start_codon:yes stop_codon:yes gene_type:complete
MATTTSTLQPPSFLQPTGYRLVVRRERFPNLEFFAQSVNHPSINLAPAIQPFRGVDAAFPGDKIDYTELNLLVMLDEKMHIYEEMVKWLESTVYKNMQRPTATGLASKDQTEYDMSLLVLTSGNVISRTITYKSAFPTFIGDIEFASTPGTLQYISFPMTFKFTSFSFT